MEPVDLAEYPEETFTRGRLKARRDTLERLKCRHVDKFRQWKETLKAGFINHNILCNNPPRLQLFVRNSCFSWTSHVSHHEDVLAR